jgi:hypothetical protein
LEAELQPAAESPALGARPVRALTAPGSAPGSSAQRRGLSPTKRNSGRLSGACVRCYTQRERAPPRGAGRVRTLQRELRGGAHAAKQARWESRRAGTRGKVAAWEPAHGSPLRWRPLYRRTALLRRANNAPARAAAPTAPDAPAVALTRPPAAALRYTVLSTPASPGPSAAAGLQAYVPRRVAQLYASACPPQPPCSAPLRAILLFADISGYSLLTRWLARNFEQGSLAITRVLNNVFGGMVSCVDGALLARCRLARLR